jgi:hypothetical protein
MANVIIKTDERIQQQNQALKEYGIDPRSATSGQREMADCVAQKTNEAYSQARKVGNR